MQRESAVLGQFGKHLAQHGGIDARALIDCAQQQQSVGDLVDPARHAARCGIDFSEHALVELAAGASDAAPVAGTALPLGAVSLVSEAAADEICGMFFGDGWRVATVDDLTMSYAAYLPREGVFWVWDDATADAAVAWEAGQ